MVVPLDLVNRVLDSTLQNGERYLYSLVGLELRAYPRKLAARPPADPDKPFRQPRPTCTNILTRLVSFSQESSANHGENVFDPNKPNQLVREMLNGEYCLLSKNEHGYYNAYSRSEKKLLVIEQISPRFGKPKNNKLHQDLIKMMDKIFIRRENADIPVPNLAVPKEIIDDPNDSSVYFVLADNGPQKTSLSVPVWPETLARFGVQLCSALAALHQQQLVHGRINAGNVLFDQQNAFLSGWYHNYGSLTVASNSDETRAVASNQLDVDLGDGFSGRSASSGSNKSSGSAKSRGSNSELTRRRRQFILSIPEILNTQSQPVNTQPHPVTHTIRIHHSVSAWNNGFLDREETTENHVSPSDIVAKLNDVSALGIVLESLLDTSPSNVSENLQQIIKSMRDSNKSSMTAQAAADAFRSFLGTSDNTAVINNTAKHSTGCEGCVVV